VNPIVSPVAGATVQLHESNRESRYKIDGIRMPFHTHSKVFNFSALQPASFRDDGQKLQKIDS
jgi:hypothetical protein